MYQVAKHPRNGKPIRVLRSEGCVWRNGKTLVWLDGTEAAKPWNRYDVGVSSVEAWSKVTDLGIEVDICVLLGDEEKAKEWILSKQYRSVRVFAVTKALLKYIGYDVIKSLGIPNMLSLENCIELYPIIERGWDTTEEDARSMIALVLQYKRTFPIVEETPHHPVAVQHGLEISAALVEPPPLYLITQFYTTPKSRRSKEIVDCLKQNVDCPYIDKIILLNEKIHDLPLKSEKIEQHVIGDRLNFKYVFQHILEVVPRDVIVVIANSDIYLDSSLRILWSVVMKNTFLSLLRWNQSEDLEFPPELFGPRDDSQDTWIVDSNSVKDRTWNWDDMDIRFGQNGCDNVVNIEMLKQKFSVANPCMSVTTHHLHGSEYRTYEPTDIIYRPSIMYLKPTGIHDLKPEHALPGTPVHSAVEPMWSVKQQGEVFTAAITEKHDEFKDGVFIKERTINLHTYENVKMTKDGLLHTYNSILIGPSSTVSNLWSETEMSVLAPCVDVDAALVAFCCDAIAENPWFYMIKYLGKVLYMRDQLGKGEFLGNDLESTKAALQNFSWDRAEVPVLCREAGFQAFCRKAHVWYPSGGLKDLPTRVEVETLRKHLVVPWSPMAANPRIIFVMDALWVTPAFAGKVMEQLGPQFEHTCILESDSVMESMRIFQGASGLVSFTGSPILHGSWLLPENAFVFEIQVESDPSIDIMQLAHVSKLKHALHTVPRRRPIGLSLVEPLVKYVQDSFAPKKGITVSNEIVMPSTKTTGFFSHAGDSFREMVGLWKERGYVTVKEVEGVQQVWLGGVGEVLLYDRPTMEWLHASKEMEWKRGLFGNPAPKRLENALPWSFWARRPRLLELLATAPRKSFSERTQSVVFYGRSENAIQLRNRSGADWSPACSEFVHLTAAKDKYPYTHEEYLSRLGNARYGLCLAGYGKKCHREIECMGMGTVPVVAPEVDMDSYAVPPVEGVHYLRVKSAADIKEKISKVSASEWESMSAACHDWWLKNASAGGLWTLTKRLAYSASESA